MFEIGDQTAEIQRVEDSGSGPRPLLGLSRFDIWSSAAHCRPTSPSRYSMTTGPIRFGFEAKGSRGGRLYFDPLWWTLAYISQKLATRQLETSAEVLIRLRHVPRPLFGLSRFDMWPRAALCRPTSRSRSSMTTGPIRFGFEAKRSGEADCTLVHFVNFGLHSQKLATRQLETSAEVPIRIRHVPRPLFGLSRVESACRAGRRRATSPSRYSMTTGLIRFGFEAKGSGVVGSSKLVYARPGRPPLDSDHAKCLGKNHLVRKPAVRQARARNFGPQ
jgi:hypothetical protein